jgi:ELWxxDGT repeat protein
VVDSRLFFTANDGTHGQELWVSDGSAAATTLFEDIVAGSGAPGLSSLRASAARLYFAVNDGNRVQLIGRIDQQSWGEGDSRQSKTVLLATEIALIGEATEAAPAAQQPAAGAAATDPGQRRVSPGDRGVGWV